jgi:hypothetical protein
MSSCRAGSRSTSGRRPTSSRSARRSCGAATARRSPHGSPATLPPLRRVSKLSVRLDALRPDTSINVADRTEGTKCKDEKSRQQISYRADEPSGRLDLDTNAGTRRNLHVDLAPVPARLDFCKADDAFCATGFALRANRGSIAFDADRHTAVNMLDCQVPLRTCTADSATGFVKLEDFRVRRFVESLHLTGAKTKADITLHSVPGDAQSDADKEVSGHVRIRAPDPSILFGFQGADIDLPPMFFAEQRRAGFSFFTIDPTGFGHANCPPGVNFKVRLRSAPDQQLKQEICAK